MKLNLGGRQTRIPGFKTVDMQPGSDIVGDIKELHFKDGEIEEIYASHCLEHFSHHDTVTVLKEWNRVLKSGGILYVGVPDFKAIVSIYQSTGMLSDWTIKILFGDQEYPLAYHYTTFDYARLRFCLHEAGFKQADKVDKFPFNVKDCSSLAYEYKIPVSLNMIAVK